MQFLVVDYADEQVSGQFLSGDSVVECFSATALEAELGECLSNGFGADVFKGCSVHYLTHLRRGFSTQSLYELSDGHSRRDCMGIDNDIWDYTLDCEGHILLGYEQSYDSFLSVA